MKTVIKNLRSNRLIIVVYLFLFLLLGYAGIEGINRQRKINKSYDYIVDTTIHKIRLLRQARINSEQIQARAINEIFHIVSRKDGNNLQLNKELASSDSILNEVEIQIENENERRLFDQMKLAWQTHKQSLDSFIKLNGNENSALEYYRRMEKNNWDNFYSTFNQFADFLYTSIKLKDKKIDDYIFISQSIINFSIGTAAVVLIILGLLVVRSVKKISHHNQVLIEKDKMLSESKNLYKELFDKSPLPKWVCDRKTLQFYEVNDAAINHYGYSREEFLKLSAFNIRLPEDQSKLMEDSQNDNFCSVNKGVRSHIKKNGEIIQVEIVLNDILYKNKEAILATGADVTERLKAEQIIKDSEELYRSLFDNSPVFIWVTEIPTLRFLDVNETAIAHFGYTKEEFLSKTTFDLLPEEDREIVKKRLQGSSSGYLGIDRHMKKNGDIINVEIRVHIINYKGKKAGLVIGVDVTEILKAEEKLRQEEEFYRTIMENSSDIQFATSERREIIFASPSVYKNFGFQKEEIIGKTSNDFWHPDDTEANKEKIKELVSTPGKTIKIEVRVLDKNKNYRWCEARISNHLFNPAIKGYVSNYSEITERKIAEQKLLKSEELYRSLFNKNPLSTFVVDKETLQFLQVNDTAVELYGYSKKEFLELSVFGLGKIQDHEYLTGIIDKKIVHELGNYHVTHIKKNGEEIIVDVALEIINYNGKEAFLAIVKDITKTLQLEKQLSTEKLNNQIEITRATVQGQEKERNELGQELHDNVNQILATAKLYLESSDTNQDRQKEFVEKGKELINSGIHEIRRISKSLVPPSLGKLSLEEALKELAVPIRLAKKHVDITIKGLDEKNLSNDLIISVYRIVQEQLNNIIKYAEASEIIVTILQQDSILELNILDNGKGFDVNKKRHGIGITNMINRASLFNGNVVIDSSPGRGCCVTVHFTLPGKEGKFIKEMTAIDAELN